MSGLPRGLQEVLKTCLQDVLFEISSRGIAKQKMFAGYV